MAEQLPNVINKAFLTCQVCLEPYKNPKVLPCIHTFCQCCLQGCIRRGSTFPCPICRSPTAVPKGGAAAFKTNFFVSSLQDVVVAQNDTEKCCDNCSDQCPALFRCLECRDNLCKTCGEAHKRTKLTRSHQVYSIADIQAGKYESEIRQSQPVLCDIHHDPLKLYCADCEMAICFNCKVTDHDGHKASNLKDEGDNNREMLDHLLGKVHARISTMEQFLQNLTQYEANFQEQKEFTYSVIKERCASLHDMVEKWTIKLIKELEHISTGEQKEVVSYREMVLSHYKSLNDVAEFTSKILSHGTDSEIVTLCKELEKRLSRLQEIPCNDFVQKQKIELQLMADGLGNLDKGKLCGEILLHNRGSVFSPHITKGYCLTSFDCTSETDDNVCYVCSLSITADNNIVILDQNNHKVKIFNGQSGHLVGEFHFGDKLKNPIALTTLADGKIAILDETRGIRVFSRSGRYIRQIYCPAKTPMGITTNSKKQILISDRRTKCIYVTSQDGTHVDAFSHEKGDPLFQKPCGIISTVTGSKIVADIGANAIKVLSPEGRLQGQYGSKGDGQGQMNIPISLCTDDYGNIIVADYNNNRIHLLDSDAKFVTYLVDKSDGLHRPTAVCINNEGHLIVGRDTGNIRVYKYIT